MLIHLPEPRAQAMINKEEKMNIQMNLKNKSDDTYVERRDRQKKKQMIGAEESEHIQEHHGSEIGNRR